ncbi:hypothetical protein DPMN_161941 [Dreissena polymorpha]|uniref:Uncharacterized protein n=1 Tax=Dreissena polymorpha TaxID=45954 RepID=A0A9D4EQJ8_DREPO|nr:hypothetical protein DPMN_161941 [Dreissena polymorpha]
MRTVYDISRKLSGKSTSSGKPVKSLNGDTLTSPKEQLERWSEHFKILTNGKLFESPP